MATGNRGLLSKVLMFIRRPLTQWRDLDRPDDSDLEAAHSRQLLKQSNERRRSNDFVRRREFDMLRKIRRRDTLAGQESNRASFFQSSLASRPDDRAGTLKKIDEIEAQMSMQWWKTRHEGASSGSTRTPGGPPTDRLTVSDTRRPGASRPGSLSRAGLLRGDRALRSTVQETRPGDSRASVFASAAPGRKDAAWQGSSGPALSASRMAALEVAQSASGPELEEAAIRFANGDVAGAEATLRAAIALPQGADPAREPLWLALFDLYRTTGQQVAFDTLAATFAQPFHRAAPRWFSVPALLDKAPAEAGDTEPDLPAALAGEVQGDATALLERFEAHWPAAERLVIDCSRLVRVDFSAAGILLNWTHTQQDRGLQVQFFGVNRLVAAFFEIVGIDEHAEVVAHAD